MDYRGGFSPSCRSGVSTPDGPIPADVRAGLDWGARFLSEIRLIVGRELGPDLFVESTRHEDVNEATDLSILQVRALRIAVRVRRHRYLAQYGDEFTIRSLGRNGAKTELDKILEGWGDFLFYGFATPDETGLASWMIGDLNVFRWRCCSGAPIPSFREHRNGAGDTRFASFDVGDFPDTFIRARGGSS